MAFDYVALAQSRPTSEFQDKPLVQAFVAAMVTPFTAVENVCDQLKTQRWIDVAIGAQLDGAGYIVGEARGGRNDDDYRAAILFRIFVNTSNATPGDLIHGLTLLTNADNVQYIEQYPATAMLFTDGPNIPSSIQSVMQGLAPAAISQLPVMVSYSWKDPFRFGKPAAPGELFVNSDGSYLEANGSDIQVTAGQPISGPSLSGIVASDLFVGDFMLDVGGPSLAINSHNHDIILDSGYALTGVFQ